MGFDQVSQNQHFPRLYQQSIRRECELVKGKSLVLESYLGGVYGFIYGLFSYFLGLLKKQRTPLAFIFFKNGDVDI
ncbi:hypothetical protein YC2023_007397 [Brassica napus]